MADTAEARPAHLWTSETRPNVHRPKGVPNRISSDLKAMVEQALSELGGVTYLVERGRDPATMSAFLALVRQILPKNVTLAVTDSHAESTAQAGAIPRDVVEAALAMMRAALESRAPKVIDVSSEVRADAPAREVSE